jgi:hypothetical protein
MLVVEMSLEAQSPTEKKDLHVISVGKQSSNLEQDEEAADRRARLVFFV